jgi:hypothetical protein
LVIRIVGYEKSQKLSPTRQGQNPAQMEFLGTEAGSQRAQEQVHLKPTEFGKQN